MNDDFWRGWRKRERELKAIEPKCTCGWKNPDRAKHYPECPYLQFWDMEFIHYRQFLAPKAS